jgi:hypothetical protein
VAALLVLLDGCVHLLLHVLHQEPGKCEIDYLKRNIKCPTPENRGMYFEGFKTTSISYEYLSSEGGLPLLACCIHLLLHVLSQEPGKREINIQLKL